MYFYKGIFCDEVIEPKKKKVIRRLRINRGQIAVYTISLAGGNDLFDIMHCANFKQKGYPRKDLYVIGLASSYDSAIILVQKIINDFYQRYETYHFKEKLLENKKDWY